MKNISRSHFLLDMTTSPSLKAKAYDEMAAKKTESGRVQSPVTGTAPYTGQWGQTQLLHLLRRTLFGVSPADYLSFKNKTMEQCLDILLSPSPLPSPPVNAYNNKDYTDPDIPLGKTWVTAAYGDNNGMADGNRKANLKTWWLGLMLSQPSSLNEKMILFWSNHLAVQMALVKDARYDYHYLTLLRTHALGNVKTMVREVGTSPAMLVYLTGNSNTNTAPNENYARELQELFTIGKGTDSHYTQEDVAAAARVLTGWVDVDEHRIGTDFNPAAHDTTDKQFSAFYNNTVIKGKKGAAGATETDELITMLFNHRETAKHFCRKLYRWFVYYQIDSHTETNVINPLADILIQNNYEIKPVLRALFASEHFYDPLNTGCLIKNPIELLVGTCRQFQVAFPGAEDVVKQYEAWNLGWTLKLMGMDPGEPTSVSGWQAYYQNPGYQELWINSTTLPLRNSSTDQLLSQGGLPVNNKTNLHIDVLAFTAELPDASSPDKLIADSLALLSPNAFDPAEIAFLKKILLSGQLSDHYWTDAWKAYLSEPKNEMTESTVLTRLRQYYTYVLQRPEYQLI